MPAALSSITLAAVSLVTKPGPVITVPGFVTKDTAAKVIELSAAGIR